MTGQGKRMTKKEYREYLKSTKWAGKRDYAIWHAGDECDECADTERLTVHHITYERIGDERPEDLQCLCWPCHRNKHISPVEAKPIVDQVEPLIVDGNIVISAWEYHGVFLGVYKYCGFLLNRVELTQEQFNQVERWELMQHVEREFGS